MHLSFSKSTMAEETNSDILEARAKLQAKFQSRIGGKGTCRRKVKAKTAAVVVADDKKLQGQFKKMGLNPIPSIEEVNMFTDKNEIIHFKDPKVVASLQANTYAISGACECKSLHEMLPKVISQMGNENLMSLKNSLGSDPSALAEQIKALGGGVPDAKEKSDDDIPDLDDTNFEEVSKA